MKTIKKENLRDSCYYIGTGPNMLPHIARWDKQDDLFHFITKAPHSEDDKDYGFNPRSEVMSSYVLLKNLMGIMIKCSIPGWDGKTAAPISVEVYRKTAILIEAFSTEAIAPMLGAEVDGSLTLEWIKRRNRFIVKISIHDQGSCKYMTIFNGEKQEGFMPISKNIPENIIEIIRKLS